MSGVAGGKFLFMRFGWDDFVEYSGEFCSRFFTLIVALFSLISWIVLVVGVFRFSHTQEAASRLAVAHFLGVGAAAISLALYFVLYFVRKKHLRILYTLSGLLLLSIVLVANSMGITAPTVDDCDEASWFNSTMSTVADIGSQAQSDLSHGNVALGSLGQSLGNCVDQQIIFGGSFLLLFFQTIAMFDVQRLLLARVRAKTYGERFVEMGIR